MKLFPIVLVALKEKMLEIAKILRDFVRGLKPKMALAFSPVLRIDNQQKFKIMKILILLKSFISLFYISRYKLRSMM